MTKVVVTGAAGDLGQKVCRHLRSVAGIDVMAIDIAADDDPTIASADLAVFSPKWAQLFDGADAVVHLAANRRRYAPWRDLWRDNVDATLNVYEAAARYGPMRFIFASSAATMDDYFWQEGVIGTDLPESPSTHYGATKVFGERIGKSFAAHRGLSVVCLRIGDVLVGDSKRSATIMSDREGIWGQQKWLSCKDLGQIVEKSIRVPHVEFAILNAVSENKGMRWDLVEAERVVGYRPESSYSPGRLPLGRALKTNLRRWIYRLVVQKLKPGP
jgi:NAD+ dependent glucose-6-phosphate dehydrogenase